MFKPWQHNEENFAYLLGLNSVKKIDHLSVSDPSYT
jgi:hypothetical protein